MSNDYLHEFTVSDRHGVPHHYSVVAHPPSEGMEILWTLIGLGGEPLARLAQSVLSDALQAAGEGSGEAVAVGSDGIAVSDRVKLALGDIELDSLDLTGAARDLRAVMTALPLSELVHKVLRYTTRDGQPLDTRRSASNFDQAYIANYLEMLNACGRVIAVNGFLPQFVTSMIE